MARPFKWIGWAWFDTALGRFRIFWQDDSMILHITLPGSGPAGSENEPPDLPGEMRLPDFPAVNRMVAGIRSALDGEPAGSVSGLRSEDQFDLSILRLDACRPFQRAVLDATAKIPRGRVSSYRALVERIGRSNVARAVGKALARNPFPIVIPCHRVVRLDRGLGGFGGGTTMKRALLELEGVGFDPAGRVRPEFIH